MLVLLAIALVARCVFFSPSGIKSLYKNFPNFKQGNTKIAVFGPTTAREAQASGLRVDVEAPKPNAPSMTAAAASAARRASTRAL